MDVMLGKDDAQPCQASRSSIEAVSWLRIIGYNAVSAWRQLAPRAVERQVHLGSQINHSRVETAGNVLDEGTDNRVVAT